MTLKEKFDSIIMRHDLSRNDFEETKQQCSEIAENYAIEFALWKETIHQDDNGLYYNESRIQVSKSNPVNINQLLEIYKTKKRL